jgi:hypothetical protein
MGAQIEEFVKNNPPATNPAEPTANNTPQDVDAVTKDDAVLANALSDLTANTDQVALPSSSAGTNITSPTSAPSTEHTPTVPPVPPPLDSDNKEMAARNNSVTIANKKIIQPLKTEPKPGLNELLAAEEAKSIMGNGLSTAVVSSPDSANAPPIQSSLPPTLNDDESSTPAPGPQPGSTFAPGATPPTPGVQAKPAGFDPNNIAL